VFVGAEKLNAEPAVVDVVPNPPNPPVGAAVAAAVPEVPERAPKLKAMLWEQRERGTKMLFPRCDDPTISYLNTQL
jgi:hypothetical protein